ncbi:MAG: hypothetical protein AVDCRST_MAG66-2792 [uncultured Pseudonocardia sp.]|uniref:Uncharacterized protein n=1 Tax=uncultured Pseudonocardia sp. TaxID=211455 RepID=A0A6J4PRG9_9PSEU|nr:MAG: hypothetical protein AVDCRST_MAG66-2792 [uncultured Pseudonocardia sp.]
MRPRCCPATVKPAPEGPDEPGRLVRGHVRDPRMKDRSWRPRRCPDAVLDGLPPALAGGVS